MYESDLRIILVVALEEDMDEGVYILKSRVKRARLAHSKRFIDRNVFTPKISDETTIHGNLSTHIHVCVNELGNQLSR